MTAYITYFLHVTQCLTCMCRLCLEVGLKACVGGTQAEDMFIVQNMNKHTTIHLGELAGQALPKRQEETGTCKSDTHIITPDWI